MGAITAICIILVCLGCFMQMMVIATYMEDSFYKLVAVGLAIEYIVQSFLTIGGAIKFIPSTGVTLPFISYGGSSLVSAFIVFAIIQALYIIQGNEDEADELEELEEYEETPDDEVERYPADDEEEAYLDDPDDGVDECDDRRNQEEHRADRYDDAPADSDDSYTAEKVSLDDLKL